MVKQVTLNWEAAGGAGGQTAMFFEDLTTPAAVATQVSAFLAAMDQVWANTTRCTPAPDIRIYNSNTGGLIGIAAFPSPTTITGTGGATAVPNAAQGLIRLRTDLVVGSRFLQGRIYVPGLAQSTQTATGELNAGAIAALQAAGQVLVDGDSYVVWHRPVNGAGGQQSFPVSASAWNEYAVQRRRRS